MQETTGGATYERRSEGKTVLSVTFGKQLTYADGRTKLLDGVTMKLPDRGGRSVTVAAQEADMVKPPDKEIGTADFSGGVTLTTSDGLAVKSATASYNDADGIVKIPGPLTFSKARMHGRGVGGTYDRNREVLWILEQAQVDIDAGRDGTGAAHVTSKSAGMARLEHYTKFTGRAHLEGEGRVTDADETTVYLSQDDERIQRVEMRGNSTISAASHATGGPQSMAARDIDLAYAQDGRTLQMAHLVENASVQLPGSSGRAGRRVAARGIDIALGPDGSTVTDLTANQNVQVDLPAEGQIPARRITSAALLANGAPPAGPGQPGGLQHASFTGSVEYRETRAANKGAAAINRTARSERLEVKTKPGFGDVESADFRSNVHFTDGPDTSADAPVAVYDIAGDLLNLSPPIAGETGPGPHVENARLQLDAVHIQMALTPQSMKADTQVRSILKPGTSSDRTGNDRAGRGGQGRSGQGTQRGAADRQGRLATVPTLPPAAGSETHMPSMLKQDKPVNVRANRLDYDGGNGVAVYSGSARLWQDETTIQADRITLDDRSGNLHAIRGVTTVMILTKAADAKPGAKPKPQASASSQVTTTVADELVYNDAKHLATYLTKAHMHGPDGDVTADKIELYLSAGGGELERAEAYGNVLSRQETRRAYGDHLTYLPDTDEYTMVGRPVRVYDDTPPNCKVTRGATLTFHKAVDTISASGNEVSGTQSQSIPCGSEPGGV
jgi:lipopolysaccharide export system protein LptA